MNIVKRMSSDEENTRNEKPYINVTEQSYKRFDIFLDQEIGKPSDYRELNFLLFTATEEDHFMIYINSPGGHLDSALAIIEGLKHTQASVTAIIQGECHSAASMIMMYCHEVIVLDSAYSMIHTASYGTVGNTGNVKAHTEFTTRQVEKLIDETYSGFLSEDEISKVKVGVEIWLDAEQIRSRMETRVAWLEAELAKLQEAEEPKPKRAPKKKAE